MKKVNNTRLLDEIIWSTEEHFLAVYSISKTKSAWIVLLCGFKVFSYDIPYTIYHIRGIACQGNFLTRALGAGKIFS